MYVEGTRNSELQIALIILHCKKKMNRCLGWCFQNHSFKKNATEVKEEVKNVILKST